MRLDVVYQSGFSTQLLAWEATLIVGARGSLRCSWLEPSGPVERTKRRHAFPLEEAAFVRMRDGLRSLPEEFQSGIMDDAAVRLVRCVCDGLIVERHRFLVLGPATPEEARFDRIWLDLVALVRPVLTELGLNEAGELDDFSRPSARDTDRTGSRISP